MIKIEKTNEKTRTFCIELPELASDIALTEYEIFVLSQCALAAVDKELEQMIEHKRAFLDSKRGTNNNCLKKSLELN
jgi:hypothetical protein